jgi:Fic/DOC family
MQHGLRRIKGGFPLSLRLIREIHGILLRGGRGANKTPGEFRRSQNWIGGSRPGNAALVPPPPERMMECLDLFEHFLHDEKHKLPALVEAGLIHVQFETIHPFLEGSWSFANYAASLRQRRIARAPSVSESLFQDSPPTLLRSPAARPNGRGLGRMGRVFSGRHRGYSSPGSRHSCSNSSSF